jgi:hypothetical protein
VTALKSKAGAVGAPKESARLLPARPRKGEEMHHTANLGVTLPADLRADIDRLAKEQGVTLTVVVIEALRRYVAASKRRAAAA